MFWLPLTARPMKFELGSKSPLTYSRAGEVAVPRFTVWLIWSAPPQLLVTVTWLAVEVDTIRSPSGLLELPLEYWQAWVLLSTWVCGLAGRVGTKFWMVGGGRVGARGDRARAGARRIAAAVVDVLALHVAALGRGVEAGLRVAFEAQ